MLTVFNALDTKSSTKRGIGSGMDVAYLVVEAQDHVSANDRIEQLEADRSYPPDDVVDVEVKGCSCACTILQALEAIRRDNPSIDRRWHLHHEGTGRGTQGARGA
jgi:hypothetical protein